MMRIIEQRPQDAIAVAALLQDVFNGSHTRKTVHRLRSGRLPADGLALAAWENDALIGSVTLWDVAVGEPHRSALLLGPLAVRSERRGEGFGIGLMEVALRRARAKGHGAILLVGCASYYGRFGFSTLPTRSLTLPGPVERNRFLGLELRPGWLRGLSGMVRPAAPLFFEQRAVA
ncbi:GNAT family N-acetyltransferase [Limibacillus halophilus]|uniref:Putative N-acetyltransferase YhbS n=1 Tax=Limibacillus halophilus TaxID=1579333 RepID=A0A839SX16_9PROT|nr:N-acetyltransferase [Limibacillus halophilus]MBB3066599.1 putative N-acetyltransferase YhbS [Limibacillus halophilus]